MDDEIEILEIEKGQPVPLLNKYKIFLYTDRPSPGLRIDEIKEFLATNLSPRFEVEVVGDFFKNYMPKKAEDKELITKELAGTKLWAEKKAGFNFRPMNMDERIESERKILSDFSITTYDSLPAKEVGFEGHYYDVDGLERTMYNMIANDRKGDQYIHIVFTSRGLRSLPKGYERLHNRSGTYGPLNIISSTSIITGPDVSSEYSEHFNSGVYDKKKLNEIFKEEVIFENDQRITAVAKGLSLQGVMSHFTSYPFCADNSCRLYDAHIQKELISSQVNGYICKKHADVLDYLRNPSMTDRDVLNALFK